MFTDSEAMIFRANPNLHVSNQSSTSLFQRHFQKNTRSVKRYGDSRKINEKERGNKRLFSGLRGYPEILLERLKKTMKLLIHDMCPHQDSDRVPQKCKSAPLPSQRTCSIGFPRTSKCNPSQETSVRHHIMSP